MTVNPTEAIWLLVTVLAIAVTLDNLRDAYRSWRAVRNTGRPREVFTLGNTRREVVRLVIDLCLLVIIIPALYRPGDTPLTPGLVVIMVVPVGMALNSILDRRDRRTIARMVAA